MAFLGNLVVTNLLKTSPAQQAIRPWWDNFEDILIYGLVLLGLVVAPTAIIYGSPLACTICLAENCKGAFEDDSVLENVDSSKNPGFNSIWVNKYCTHKAIREFIFYFPFVILSIALVIIAIERMFMRLFKSTLMLNSFYEMVVHEILEPEGEDETQRPVLDNVSKKAFEVSQMFMNSSRYFWGHLCRSIAKFLLSGFLLALLILGVVPIIEADEYIYCNVHGYGYECSGHPQRFYSWVIFVAVADLFLIMFSNLVDLFYLLVPRVRRLNRVMAQTTKCKEYKEKCKGGKNNQTSEEMNFGTLNGIYYKSRDLRLLLDLLADSSGVALSIKILSMFDEEFNQICHVRDVETSVHKDTLLVNFNDAPIVLDSFLHMSSTQCMYITEIIPRTEGKSMHALLANPKEYNLIMKMTEVRDVLKPATPKRNESKGPGRSSKFTNLDPNVEYTVIISTIINGRTIATNHVKIKNIETDEKTPILENISQS